MAPDNTSTELIFRASRSEPKKAHSFFGSFPSKTRGEMYDLIFQQKEHAARKDAFGQRHHHYRTRTTLSNVRLVSSRFKLEYDERDKYHLPKNHFWFCQGSVPQDIDLHGLYLRVPTLAVRTTVLHLDLKRCRQEQDARWCLIPADGSPRGIGGSKLRTVGYKHANLPLLEKLYFHVSCRAMRRAVNAGQPSPKIPMLAQISTFPMSYDQAPSQDEYDRARFTWGLDLRACPYQPGAFFVRRQTQGIWTHANGWDNEAK
jgi:hypothetical protein